MTDAGDYIVLEDEHLNGSGGRRRGRSAGRGGLVVGGKARKEPRLTAPDDEEIVLSSDDEAPKKETDLDLEVVTVRPKSKSTLLEADANVLEGPEMALEHKSADGYVKEFVSRDGLGILFGKDCGLVLFHAAHTWLASDGKGPPFRVENADEAREELVPGTPVNFLYYHIMDEKWADFVGSGGYLRHAAALWTGDTKPDHLLRQIRTPEHRHQMEEQRKEFLEKLEKRDFLPLGLVRGRGQIAGYINEKVGILKTEDGKHPVCKVLFHESDIYMYGHPLVLKGDTLSQAVPVGLRVCFDARALPSRDRLSSEVEYQSCAVFIGAWPTVPHPTQLPGGPGTRAPCYEESKEKGTFYYLQPNLKANLDRKWNDFKRICREGVKYTKVDVCIKSAEDFRKWQSYYTPSKFLHRRPTNNRRGAGGIPLKANYHMFKEPPKRFLDEAQRHANEKLVKPEPKNDEESIKQENFEENWESAGY